MRERQPQDAVIQHKVFRDFWDIPGDNDRKFVQNNMPAFWIATLWKRVYTSQKVLKVAFENQFTISFDTAFQEYQQNVRL